MLDAATDAAFRERRASAKGGAGTGAAAGAGAAAANRSTAGGPRVSAETSAASDDPAPGENLPLTVRRADALARIAESFLAHGAEALASGERHHVVVHVDAATLRESCDGRCEHEDGPSLPIETARRLGCDASVVAIVEDENGEPLNVGRRTRTIPPTIRRALFARDKNGCRFPGCTNKHYVDGHHIKHWANGGETRLSNLVVLCRFHHRLVHEGGVGVQVLDDGALRFVVKGRAFDSPSPARQAAEHYRPGPDVTRGNWSQMVADFSASGITVTPNTAVTRWRGERMDYGLAIEALLCCVHPAARTGDVSAETV